MSRRVRTLSLSISALALTTAAHAQATRTWVSSAGNDADPCSRTAPCKTFAGALPKTARGGEISVIDAAGYGAPTITKSITISGDGTLASVLFSSVNGLTINITDAADTYKKVIIRNVSFNGGTDPAVNNGQPTGVNGIRFLAGKELQLENVDIYGCTNNGIDVAMGSGAAGTVYVQGSTIANCPTGIRVTATSGFAEVILDDVRIEGTTNALELQANGRLIARDSTFAGTGLNQNGVLLSASTAQATLDRCTIGFNNVAGVNAAVAGAIARVGSSSFITNSTGVASAAGAQMLSDGRNLFAGNGSDGNFTGSLVVK
jgi:hypothetical protein